MKEPEGSSTGSVLREGRYSNAGSTPGKKMSFKPRRQPHDHKHKKVFVEGNIKLSQDDRYAEFPMKLRMPFIEAQKVVEHFSLLPIKEGGKSLPVEEANEIPVNYTDLGGIISMAPNVSFEKKKPWGIPAEE